MIQKITGKGTTRTVIADSSDELDEALEHYKAQGWHVVFTVRQTDGSYRSELVKDEE